MFDLGRSVAVQRQDKFVDLHDRLKKLLKVREQKTESLVFYDIGLWMGEDHLKAMQQYGRLPGSGFFFFFNSNCAIFCEDTRSERAIYGFMINSSLLYTYIFFFFCAYLPLSDEADDCSV